MNTDRPDHAEPSNTHPPADRRALLAGIGGIAAGAFLAGTKSAHAGPLTPPPGPVTSTPGPEPRIAINQTNTPGDLTARFRITQPGSYYLTGNITGEPSKAGIDILTSGVTLDLNGFDLVGVPGSLEGIRSAVGGGLEGIKVFNGSVRNWGATGVSLSNCNGLHIDRVNAIANAINGIRTASACTVTCCTARTNGAAGISVGSACTVIHCTATNNNVGIVTSTACTIVGCTMTNNATNGLTAGAACTITGCTASSNSGSGIVASGASVISHCTASTNNGVGLAAGASTISDCTAVGNASDGIAVTDACTIVRCTATSNNRGVTTGDACTVSGCNASSNTSHGIVLLNNCRATDCTCAGNGTGAAGSGIRATGSDNRIEANNCVDNDVGVECTAAGNLIVRNTCSGNTTLNWSLVSGNVFGAIVDRTSPGSGAVSGNTALSSLVSTDPNANCTF